MKPFAFPVLSYVLRPEDERAAFTWWLARRPARWSVILHQHRCGGDDRDANLMRWLTETTRAHYDCGLPLPPEARLPLAHLFVRLDAEWPLGHLGVSFYMGGGGAPLQ